MWRNDAFDIRHLRRLDILFYHHDQPLDVEGDLPSDGLLLLEVVTLIANSNPECTQRCIGSNCSIDGSLRIWLDGFYRLVQSHRDRYPLLRSIDLGFYPYGSWSVSFATRAGRNEIRLAALAPKLRSVGLTIRDTSGRPWLEEWDAE